MEGNTDLIKLNKLLHCVNVVKYTQKNLEKRRVLLSDCHIPDNIKLRLDELNHLKVQIKKVETKIDNLRKQCEEKRDDKETP